MWNALPLLVLLTWGVIPAPAKLLLPSHFQRNHNFKRFPTPQADEVGSKLILTPYIEAGNISEARNLSAVSGGPFPADIPSYSGFFTVNKQYDSNLFFWFFPAEVSNSRDILKSYNLYKLCIHQYTYTMYKMI
jgi:vitellogenic carboxypeptidase-like protein